ncbi:MAG: hypothetical protein ABIR70_07120 [Bryobacteraceae bacterium]
MAERGIFEFEIRDLTPTTLSMARLHQYLPHLIELFGNQDNIHLLSVDEGSAKPRIFAKPHVAGRVERRLLQIKTGHFSRKVFKAVETINELLAEDDTSAVLRSPHPGIVIEFPGKLAAKDLIIGPLSEVSEIQGELIQVGGRDETISVYLRNEGDVYICTATKEQGRQISNHLFTPVRVRGAAKWIRRENGKWKLLSLVLDNFTPLQLRPLSEAINNLRALGKEFGVEPDLFGIPEEE